MTLEKTPKKYSAPALEKGLDVLELLARSEGPMALSEIAIALGRSKNELFRMIVTLLDRGYIQKQEGTELYHVTNFLFDLGLKTPQYTTLLECALPVLRNLADEIRQSCHLAVRSGMQVVVIARVENPDYLGFSVRVGYRRDLIFSGSGRALLSWSDDQSRKTVIEHFTKIGAPEFDGDAFVAELNAYKEAGFVRAASGATIGVTDLCAPIFASRESAPVASLSTPFSKNLDQEISIEKASQKIVSAAKTISDLISVHGTL